jgi:alkanesulfonate monooxygenase SsuD/methylene tetrahydromethanopterin reductase-like flavin-dependent oxidoreductase (luciferase family)
MELPMRPFGLSLPEMFIASSSAELIGRAARRHCTPFMSFGHRGLASALNFRRLLCERWQAGGGEPDAMPLAVQRYIYVTDDDREAQYAAQCVRDLARATNSLSSRLPSRDGIFLRLMPMNDEPPLADFIDNAIIGSPNHCAEKLHEEIEALKPSHLCCFMAFAGIGREQTLASMERFGYDVIPQLSGLVSMRQAA